MSRALPDWLKQAKRSWLLHLCLLSLLTSIVSGSKVMADYFSSKSSSWSRMRDNSKVGQMLDQGFGQGTQQLKYEVADRSDDLLFSVGAIASLIFVLAFIFARFSTHGQWQDHSSKRHAIESISVLFCGIAASISAGCFLAQLPSLQSNIIQLANVVYHVSKKTFVASCPGSYQPTTTLPGFDSAGLVTYIVSWPASTKRAALFGMDKISGLVLSKRRYYAPPQEIPLGVEDYCALLWDATDLLVVWFDSEKLWLTVWMSSHIITVALLLTFSIIWVVQKCLKRQRANSARPSHQRRHQNFPLHHLPDQQQRGNAAQ